MAIKEAIPTHNNNPVLPVQKDMIKSSAPDAKVPSKDSRDGKLGGKASTTPTTPAKAK